MSFASWDSRPELVFVDHERNFLYFLPKIPQGFLQNLLEHKVIWGHIDILIVAVRRLSRRWKVKTRLAGPSPTSPMKATVELGCLGLSGTSLRPEDHVIPLYLGESFAS
jgi:hypothetical protein